MEIWKDIKGYEGHYQASSLGRIRNKDGVELKQYTRKRQGSRWVFFRHNNIQCQHYVHQLVAAAFFEDYLLNAGMRVKHICGVSDNRPESLVVYNEKGCFNVEGEYKKHYKGTVFDKKTGKFFAVIRVEGKSVYSRGFDTVEEASEEYNKEQPKYEEVNKRYRAQRVMDRCVLAKTKKRRKDKRVKEQELYEIRRKMYV